MEKFKTSKKICIKLANILYFTLKNDSITNYSLKKKQFFYLKNKFLNNLNLKEIKMYCGSGTTR